MSKYINVEKQLVRLYRLGLSCEDVVKQFLLTAQTADVVEVVRCRDCKHSGYQYRDFHGTERVVCWKDGYGICKNANGYCDEGDFRDEKDGDEDYAQ